MADPFRVEPKGKSWADIVEEDEQSNLLNSQHEDCPLISKEEPNGESKAALEGAHAVSAMPSSDQQADSNKDDIAPQEQPPKVEDKPILTGSRASKWASAPSEPRGQSKWQTASSSAATSSSTNAFKGGSMTSKWASAPDSPSRSRYDSNHHTRHDRFGGNDDYHGRNADLRRNNRWREDPPSGGRLNRSAFEDDDVRNGGFNNKANFSRERRCQEYHELTNKEAVKDEAPEHTKAIEGWNAYKPPAEENEETAKQLVKAANEVEQTSADQTTKEEQQDVPIARREDFKEIEVSPTKAVELVKPTVSSSPSLKPVSSFSWADDIPDDNSDDDSDYPIPADWITPKVAAHAGTTEVQEASAASQAAENDITDDLSAKHDPGVAADAKNSLPEEAKSEQSRSTGDTDPVDTTTTVAAAASEATAATSPTESPKEEKPTYTWRALDDYKEPETVIPKSDDSVKIGKEQEEAAIAAWNSVKLPEEPEEEVAAGTTQEKKLSASQATEEQPSWNQSVEQEKSSWGQPEEEQPSWSQSAVPSWGQADKEQPSDTMETQQQQEPVPEPKPTYTWGALDDYKEPEIIAHKSHIIKVDKEKEEAAVAAWNSANFPEEPEEKAVATTIEDEKPSWDQATEEQPSWSSNVEQVKPSWSQTTEEKPSWNQSIESSWNLPTEASWNQPDDKQPKAQSQESASEPKPVYTWAALDDYKTPEAIAKPKSDIVIISKEDEEAAISAWNNVKLPEEPELLEEKSSEPVNDTPTWSSAAQDSAPVQPKPSWNANAQESEAVKAEPSWNVTSAEPSWNADAQATSWGAVEQPSWSEPSTTAKLNTSEQQQQGWSTNSFQEGSSVTSKSSFKDTWRNKLPTTVDDNAGGWKSFAETVAAPPEPASKPTEKEPTAAAPREPTLKRTEKGSAASKWSHDRYNGAELIHPKPSQKKPHNLSFKLNDFKEANGNEVHVSWNDIQAQDSPKISIKDDKSDRQVTVGLSGFSQANPQQDIVLRLSDITAGRPLNSAQQQQQQQQGPQEVVLSFSELNKGRNEASNSFASSNPAADISDSSSSGPKEIVCKLSDFGKSDKPDGPLDITLKLF